MEIICPECKGTIFYSGILPRFCSHCASSLENVTSQIVGQTGSGNDRTVPGTRADGTKVEDTSIGKAAGPRQNSSDTPGLDATKADVTLPPRAASSAEDDVTLDSRFSLVDDQEAPETVKDIGPYQLIRKLGSGGMGTVYEAVNRRSGQRVALKLLGRQFRSTGESVQRFVRESRIAASINHPRSTFVYEAGEIDGRFYITMELMSGGTLKEAVERDGAFTVEKAVDCVLDMIDGLQAAHSAGIIHRDLKPSNIFVDTDGRVKIGDFGLSKSLVTDASLTRTGTFMGTPQFAAPEQLRAAEVDERADIYAIGGTLFYLLTGQPPFAGGAAQVIASIASETAPHVNKHSSGIPRELNRIVASMLEKDPARRPPNLSALRAALVPFATRGASLADVGRRMAAFFIDLTISGFLAQIVAGMAIIPLIAILPVVSTNSADFLLVPVLTLILNIAIVTGYFVLSEWRWGTTAGKWIFGMRVIGRDGAPPGPLASLVRASMIPGISWVVNFIPIFFDNQFASSAEVQIEDMIRLIAVSQIYAQISWVPLLLIMATARARNGYRGLHDLLTGSRVVRLAGALESLQLTDVPGTLPGKIDSRADLATASELAIATSYRLVGRLISDSESTVLMARDEKLERAVWIFFGPEGVGRFQGDRNSVSRPNRLRVLSHGESESGKWHATEAIDGAPLIDLMKSNHRCDWQEVRSVFQELALELDTAVDDGTLPKTLRIDQFWVDQHGRARMIDRSLQPSSRDSTEQSENKLTEIASLSKDQADRVIEDQVFTDELPAVRAARAFSALLEVYVNTCESPQHVVEFSRQVSADAAMVRATPGQELLCPAARKLAELSDRPSSWRWDDRLGLLAIAAGLELPVYILAISILSLVMQQVLSDHPFVASGRLIAAGSAIAFASGWIFSGSLSIWFSEVVVRRRRGTKPASKLRCAIRNTLVWLPFFIVIAFFLTGMQHQLQPSVVSPGEDLPPAVIGGLIMLASLPIMGLILAACCWALLNPSRGVPDLLAATRIVRK